MIKHESHFIAAAIDASDTAVECVRQIIDPEFSPQK